jgi:hypothetical protein
MSAFNRQARLLKPQVLVSAVIVVAAFLFALMAGSAVAATPGVCDLSAYSLATEPLLDTAVVTLSPTDTGFEAAVQTALSVNEVVCAIGVSPDVGVKAGVPDAQASAINRLTNGAYGLVALVANKVLTDEEALDGLTRLVNNAPKPLNRNEAATTLAGADYLKNAGYFGWGARRYDGGTWTGDVSQYHTEWCRFNDGNSTSDYWISDVSQRMDPGSNDHGGYYQSNQLSAKFYKYGLMTGLLSCLPNSTPSSTPSVTLTLGWLPSAALTFDFNKSNITITNRSSPSSGYAYWIADWKYGSSAAKGYSELKPGYTAVVTEGKSFQAKTYVTVKWMWNGIVRSTTYAPYTFAISKPAP